MTHNWCRFDFVILVASLISLSMSSSQVGIFKLARVMRLVRLIKRFEGLRALTETFVLSITSVGQVSLILLGVFFCYGVVGMQLFHATRYGSILGPEVNFDNLLSSCYCLFLVSTGEWIAIMEDLTGIVCSLTQAHCLVLVHSSTPRVLIRRWLRRLWNAHFYSCNIYHELSASHTIPGLEHCRSSHN